MFFVFFLFFFLPCYFSLKLRCFARMPASSGFDFLGLLVVSLEDGQVDEAPPPPPTHPSSIDQTSSTHPFHISASSFSLFNLHSIHLHFRQSSQLDKPSDQLHFNELIQILPPLRRYRMTDNDFRLRSWRTATTMV